MPEENAAIEAFQNSFPTEVDGNQPSDQGGEVEPSQATPTPETSSREIDISGLPEEAQIFIRAREREMQADYTRKTQEAAEQRRQAEQAIQFVEALNSDPNFAYQAYNQLQASLAAQGYLQDPTGYEVEPEYDEYGDVVDAGPDPYQQEIAELAWRQQQMENQWVEASLSAQIDRQLATIQSQHPDWDEGDIQAVIDYGFATGGDLHKAADLYQGQVDRALSRYLEKKGSVNTPSPLPNAPAQSGGATPQTEKEVTAAAQEYVRRQLSG